MSRNMIPSVSHAIYDPKGNILAIGVMQEGVQVIETAQQMVYIGDATHQDLIDPATKTLKKGAKGTPPSKYHQWDPAALVWVVDLPTAKADLKRQVNAARLVRLAQAMTYNGMQLQADDASYDAVSKKLDAISNRPAGAGNPPASALVWRDASNTTQTFANANAYKTFLAGFLSAIDDRNSSVDQWAWTKKDTIDAAADWTSLSAIDPTS